MFNFIKSNKVQQETLTREQALALLFKNCENFKLEYRKEGLVVVSALINTILSHTKFSVSVYPEYTPVEKLFKDIPTLCVTLKETTVSDIELQIVNKLTGMFKSTLEYDTRWSRGIEIHFDKGEPSEKSFRIASEDLQKEFKNKGLLILFDVLLRMDDKKLIEIKNIEKGS